MQDAFAKVARSADFLKNWNGGGAAPPDLCVVLGSGLADAVPGLDAMSFLRYADIPEFQASLVPGHKGELRVGDITTTLADGTAATRRVAFLRGRTHAYEGHTASEVVHNLRSVIAWGARGVVLTNAAGCLRSDWSLGEMMLITDHINATGLNPLIAAGAGGGTGKAFQDLTSAYDPEWQQHFRGDAKAKAIELREGTYYGVLGPSYETPAEIRMMQTLGARAVGMSTVLETIAARHMGVRVAGISCLTNYGAGLLSNETLEHGHVVHMGKKFASLMASLVLHTLVRLPL